MVRKLLRTIHPLWNPTRHQRRPKKKLPPPVAPNDGDDDDADDEQHDPFDGIGVWF